jgi:glycosyltransferase involved in cell wall biosynthesis
MKIQYIMISNGIGGAEKRYANLFNFSFQSNKHEFRLAINERLFHLLNECSINLDSKKCFVMKDLLPPLDKSWAGLSYFWNRFAMSPTANMRFYLRQFNKYAREVSKPDVIHFVRSASLLLPKLKQYKTVVSLFNSSISRRPRRFMKNIFDANSFDVLNPLVAKKFELFGLPREKLNIAPCSFIDYSKVPSINQAIKNNSIVFSGRLIDIKGVNLFLNAAKIIKTTCGPKHKFIIMGDGPQESYVTREIKKSNLTNVHYLGFVPTPMTVLSCSKMFCSLQRDSNYPSQSLIEAMACGCAVIATDVGDTRLLVDEKVGILIPPDRPDKLADAICDLLNDPKRCSDLGKIARERVLSIMKVERYMTFLEEIYENLYKDSNITKTY